MRITVTIKYEGEYGSAEDEVLIKKSEEFNAATRKEIATHLTEAALATFIRVDGDNS